MRARDAAGHIGPHRHGQSPAQIDRQVIAVRAAAQHDLGHHAHAEHDEHERAQKLRRRLPQSIA